ncbi:MAG: pentapeptide repeat-containing protein [Methylococcales bacterium]
MIAEKHRYFAVLVDNCAWPEGIHMRQQLHVNAFTQFLGADHKGLLAIILKLMIWFTVGLMPPLLLLAIQIDFLAAQIDSVTSWQQTAVLFDCLLAGYFWNNILQKTRRALSEDWNPPIWKRYLPEGWILWFCLLLIIGFSWLVALVPLSDYERKVHNHMPAWLAGKNCLLKEDIEKFGEKEDIERLRDKPTESLTKVEAKTLQKFTAFENNYNRQLVTAAKNAREWKSPYQCSNKLTWWFIDRSDSWLNMRLDIHRWLNLPDKVFVENRKSVQPQWLNRLKSELVKNTDNSKVSKPSPDENTSKTKNTDRPNSFKTLDYFLPVNKERQHFHFARFSRSFLPNAKMKQVMLQGADLSRTKLQGADLQEAKLQGVNLQEAKLQGANLRKAMLQGADFSMAELQDADLFEVDLRGVVLKNVKLQRADLQLAKLQSKNLSGLNLQDANLSMAELQRADLSKAKLQGAVFEEAELQDANLSEAELQGANLSGAKLQGAVLEEAELQGANLSGAELQGAVFSGAELQGANLSRAELQDTILAKAQLQGAVLENSNLQRASLWRAKLQDVNLSGIKLQGAYLEDAIMTNADLSRAKLQGADLSEAELQGADLSETELQGAVFSGAKLQGADLSEAKLQGAIFSGTELQGAVLKNLQLTGVQFYEAKLDHVLILNPLVEWELDKHLISNLMAIDSAALNKESKKRLLDAIKRIQDTGNKQLPNISEATLETPEHRCLLLTDNKQLKNNAQHVCDNASDSSINPLTHLHNWANYNALESCKSKRFFEIEIDEVSIRDAYENVLNYQSPGNNAMRLQQASENLFTLAYFLYTKQLLQIHQDKTKSCKARQALGAWYKRSGYKNNPERKDSILNLKLKPFPTS